MIPNNVSCHVLLLCFFFFSLCHEVKILGTFCRTQFSSLLLRVLFAPDADPSVSCPYTRGCRVGCVALGSSRKVLGAPGCCSPHLLVTRNEIFDAHFRGQKAASLLCDVNVADSRYDLLSIHNEVQNGFNSSVLSFPSVSSVKWFGHVHFPASCHGLLRMSFLLYYMLWYVDVFPA